MVHDSNNYFFKSFEPTQDTISCGRHPASHSLLATDAYTKTNALKLISILDSLFYIILFNIYSANIKYIFAIILLYISVIIKLNYHSNAVIYHLDLQKRIMYYP
jgi:hypothetical protein